MTKISLVPQPEDLAVIDAVVPFLKEEFVLTSLASAPERADPLFWPRIAELGWTTAGLDEEHGGTGFDLVQDMLMNREFGRFLAPVSLLSTSLGIRLLALSGRVTPEAILHGRERVGFAAFVAGGELGELVSGEVHLIDSQAEHFVIVEPNGSALISRDALNDIEEIDSLDPTTSLARVQLQGVPAVYRAEDETGLNARKQLLIAAQLTGIALAASDMAAEYAKVREQFGKPIGAFQAVAHLCVDAAVKARASDAQVALAAIAMRDGWRDAAAQVVAASHVAGHAAFLAGTNNIQVHAGMGYSAESGAHLFLKRCILLKRLLAGSVSAATEMLLRQHEEE